MASVENLNYSPRCPSRPWELCNLHDGLIARRLLKRNSRKLSMRHALQEHRTFTPLRGSEGVKSPTAMSAFGTGQLRGTCRCNMPVSILPGERHVQVHEHRSLPEKTPNRQ